MSCGTQEYVARLARVGLDAVAVVGSAQSSYFTLRQQFFVWGTTETRAARRRGASGQCQRQT